MKLTFVTHVSLIAIIALVIFIYKLNEDDTSIEKRPRTGNLSYTRSVKEDAVISPGIIVLGMHRSGTSLLTGLLTKGCGYHVGDNLLNAHPTNPKGFYERTDVMFQDDLWLGSQNMAWHSSDKLFQYDPEIVLFEQNPWDEIIEKDIKLTDEEDKTYEHEMPGVRSLEFLTNRNNRPWLLKEPRLCITLPAWLDQLEVSSVRYPNDNIKAPSAILTYRHPVEVAESLHHRDNFPLSKGYLLWLIYNQRAIENSAGLCRVYTSNFMINQDPFTEILRITKELTEKCGVPPPPKEINHEVLDLFYDEGLEHTHFEFEGAENCFEHEFKRAKDEFKEQKYYREVIKVYCDMKSGEAYEPDYVFPPL